MSMWRIFRRDDRRPDELGQAVGGLVQLQLALCSKQPRPSPASVGYVFGMFDCAAQIADIDLNTPRCQQALKLTMAMVFPNQAHECVRIIGEHQLSPEFNSAATTGGNDYNGWVRSQGKARPTSFWRVLDE